MRHPDAGPPSFLVDRLSSGLRPEAEKVLMSRLAAVLALCAFTTLLAGSASAIQFPLSGTERLHTSTSGEGGAQWNTGSTTAGGQVSYDSGTGELSVSGVLNVLNYWDSNDLGCPTDVGSNCQVNFSPDLDMTVEMALHSISAAPFAGPGFDTLVTIKFETTADGIADFILVDPSDATTLLEGDFAAGTFQSTPTTGVSASILYNSLTGVASFGSGQISDTGFLAIDPSSPYASLVESGGGAYIAVNFTTLDNFVGAGGGLDEIIQFAVANGTLPDFSAEGQGQIFRVDSGDFVLPEPTTSLLFVLGFAGLARFSARVKS
jgi:hypothetical protein